MTLDRRDFLAGAAALAGGAMIGGAMTGAAARAAGDAQRLRAAPGLARIAPASYPQTPIWGYEGGVPGPEIRVAQGARVARRFVNGLPQPSTVHWHGVRLANAMDGAPGLTQETVPPGGEFLYDFVAPDAGTYWYHSHDRSWEQLARGLCGALIVEEPAPPQVDRDAALLIEDWRLADDASLDESFDDMHDLAHAGRIGNWLTVNGDGAWRMTTGRNARLRLRLVNAANARIMSLGLAGLEGWVVALDGQPLDAPRRAERLILAPAQRIDLIVDVTAAEGEDAFLVSHERGGGFAIAAFAVGEAVRPGRLPPPGALAPNPVARPGDAATARAARLVMEGGAMGGLRGAMLGGRRMGIRELAAAGRAWAFNGMADMPQTPLIEAARGETVVLTIVNDTAWPHAMHLHGHHFRRLGADGAQGPLRDTLLMDRNETARIAFVADNPGDWLLHCHMLEHAAGGMMTWLRVA